MVSAPAAHQLCICVCLSTPKRWRLLFYSTAACWDFINWVGVGSCHSSLVENALNPPPASGRVPEHQRDLQKPPVPRPARKHPEGTHTHTLSDLSVPSWALNEVKITQRPALTSFPLRLFCPCEELSPGEVKPGLIKFNESFLNVCQDTRGLSPSRDC